MELARTGLLPCAGLAVLATLRQVFLPFREEIVASLLPVTFIKQCKKANSKPGKKLEDEESGGSEAGASTVSSKSRCLQEQIILARTTPVLIANMVSLFIIIQVSLKLPSVLFLFLYYLRVGITL